MSAVVLAHGHQARDDLLVQLEGENWNQHGARLAARATSPNERGVAKPRAAVTAHASCMRLMIGPMIGRT